MSSRKKPSETSPVPFVTMPEGSSLQIDVPVGGQLADYLEFIAALVRNNKQIRICVSTPKPPTK
jgi:hypothetical protein